jgi:hypothetical protein
MSPFLYKCPNSGHWVQALRREQMPADDGDTYEPFNCIVCGQSHLVNVATGRVLGQDGA